MVSFCLLLFDGGTKESIIALLVIQCTSASFSDRSRPGLVSMTWYGVAFLGPVDYRGF